MLSDSETSPAMHSRSAKREILRFTQDDARCVISNTKSARVMLSDNETSPAMQGRSAKHEILRFTQDDARCVISNTKSACVMLSGSETSPAIHGRSANVGSFVSLRMTRCKMMGG